MSAKAILDYLLEKPVLYKLVQNVLAGGGHATIKSYLKKQIPKNAHKILDQGCGTGEYALLFGDRYTGLDYDAGYMKHARVRYPGQFLVGDASNMRNLKNKSFDVVFAVGLHHHLSDQQATKAFSESLRVTKSGGKIIIVDAMLPINNLNLVGLFLRKIDRGRNVRKIHHTLALIPEKINYRVNTLSSFPLDYVVITIQR